MKGWWAKFCQKNRQPCIRCGLPVWFAGYAPEHGHCMSKQIREDHKRRNARLIAEELDKIQEARR